ncbi:hypothetical protein [Amycolatopsis antarctica]|nr:hypothetical protein [Amycolatopsis antarctica]
MAALEQSADLVTPGDRTGEAFPRTFSVNLFHGQGGQVYRSR